MLYDDVSSINMKNPKCRDLRVLQLASMLRFLSGKTEAMPQRNWKSVGQYILKKSQAKRKYEDMWIDCTKAFYIVQKLCIIQCRKMYKLSDNVI